MNGPTGPPGSDPPTNPNAKSPVVPPDTAGGSFDATVGQIGPEIPVTAEVVSGDGDSAGIRFRKRKLAFPLAVLSEHYHWNLPAADFTAEPTSFHL